jgi:hypothetical protein
MGEKEIDDLVAAIIKGKPQFKSAIERMDKATKALSDRNVDAAFRKYLEKIAESDDVEAARFIAEMDKYAHATQATLKTLDSIDIDRKEVIYSQFPQARKIIVGALFVLACLAGLIFYLVAYKK